MNHREAIAAEVRAATARANLTQRELADRVGLSPNGMNQKMRGLSSFTVEELIAVADVTDTTVASLLPEKVNIVAA